MNSNAFINFNYNRVCKGEDFVYGAAFFYFFPSAVLTVTMVPQFLPTHLAARLRLIQPLLRRPTLRCTGANRESIFMLSKTKYYTKQYLIISCIN